MESEYRYGSLMKGPDTILIVDDDEMNRAILENLFSSFYAVEEAENGREGLEKLTANQEKICAVLLDVVMPEMDGLQLCAWVREHCPDIQLILCTGFPDFEYAQQAIQYEVADFVLKPTTEEGLSAAVKKACQRLQKDSGIQKRSLLLEQQALLGELGEVLGQENVVLKGR